MLSRFVWESRGTELCCVEVELICQKKSFSTLSNTHFSRIRSTFSKFYSVDTFSSPTYTFSHFAFFFWIFIKFKKMIFEASKNTLPIYFLLFLHCDSNFKFLVRIFHLISSYTHVLWISRCTFSASSQHALSPQSDFQINYFYYLVFNCFHNFLVFSFHYYLKLNLDLRLKQQNAFLSDFHLAGHCYLRS